ncbi:MAG: uncharacterized protein JWR35_56 [Marmoricola sp.]|jgi:DNA anti-recombination protein RmuC|nr:uncharacterized protein [Marmoricola sp.]
MKEEVDALIAELREAIKTARSMPMSASAVVNRAEFLGRIRQLQTAIDTMLTEATALVGDRDAVVATGHEQAEDLLHRARQERDQMVSDTDVYQLAQQRADETTGEAEKHAAELRAEADEYVEATLANFELTLERTLDTVKRGRARLTGGHHHNLGDDSDVAGMSLPDHLE